MAGENDPIIAVFKADTSQYQTALNNLTTKLTDVDAKQTAAGATTKQFTGHTKSAAQSIRTLSAGLGGVTGLMAIFGKVVGVDTQNMQELVHVSRMFVHTAKEIQHITHLSNLAKKEGIATTEKLTIAEKALNVVRSLGVPVLGLILGAVAALVVAYVRYKEQIFGLTEAEKEKIKADDGMLISDEKTRESHNENIKVIRDLQLEYLILTGVITETQGALDKIKNKNKDALDKIAKDTKTKLEETNSWWNKLWLAGATGLGGGSLELNKQIKEKLDIIRNGKLLENEQKKIQAEQSKIAEAEIAKKENERLKKERDDARKKELQEFREWQEKRNDINVEASEKRIQQELDELEEIAKARIKAQEDINKLMEDGRIADAESANDLIKNLHKEQEKNKKEKEKERVEEIEREEKMLDLIFDAQQKAFDKKQELRDKELSDQDKNIDRQRDLADKGLANTLAFEEKRKADMERQQQIEVERQKKVKLLETFLNSLASYSKESGLKPGEALQKALLDIAMATAAMAVFAEDGGIIGDIKDRTFRGRRHSGGGDVLLHAQTGEGILSRREMTS